MAEDKLSGSVSSSHLCRNLVIEEESLGFHASRVVDTDIVHLVPFPSH